MLAKEITAGCSFEPASEQKNVKSRAIVSSGDTGNNASNKAGPNAVNRLGAGPFAANTIKNHEEIPGADALLKKNMKSPWRCLIGSVSLTLLLACHGAVSRGLQLLDCLRIRNFQFKPRNSKNFI